VRRESGKEQVVQVHYDEGIANHIGPEPCAGICEDVGEASVGERAGQPLSRDRKLIPGADAVCLAEGNMSKSGLRVWIRSFQVFSKPITSSISIVGETSSTI
jgi:hypothetical protein